MRTPRSSRLRYSLPSPKKKTPFPLLLLTALISLGIGLAGGIGYVKLQQPDEIGEQVRREDTPSLPQPVQEQEEETASSPSRPPTSGESPEKSRPQPPEVAALKRTISSGDTASSILDCYLTPAQIYELGRTARDVYPLTRLKVGNPYTLRVQGDRLLDMEYEIDRNEKLRISCTDSGFDVCRVPIVYDIETAFVSGTITSNLFNAIDHAGETPGFAITLADIFAWDVDFVRDIRKGDHFKAIVEKRYRNGKPAGYGRIQAAEFINQGHRYTAFYFEHKDGHGAYYDAEGKSMRKAFLKAPLHFSRISSGYSMSRMHPILKRRRPHQGIDYAAPTGTPIRTVADGTIIAKRRTKAAGRYIKIRHRNGYETVYNHMSKYARGMHKGKKVVQGQVIGYVGSTGYATGPHLDFRMKRHGKYLNPLKVKSPSGEPVPKSEMQAFRARIAPFMAALKDRDDSAPVDGSMALAKATLKESPSAP
jgi:murein DD-endopeptidase MepM/ murein hydrolase activator NlpD